MMGDTAFYPEVNAKLGTHSIPSLQPRNLRSLSHHDELQGGGKVMKISRKTAGDKVYFLVFELDPSYYKAAEDLGFVETDV